MTGCILDSAALGLHLSLVGRTKSVLGEALHIIRLSSVFCVLHDHIIHCEVIFQSFTLCAQLMRGSVCLCRF